MQTIILRNKNVSSLSRKRYSHKLTKDDPTPPSNLNLLLNDSYVVAHVVGLLKYSLTKLMVSTLTRNSDC